MIAILPVLGLLLLAAHFLRFAEAGLAAAIIGLACLGFTRQGFVRLAWAAALALACLVFAKAGAAFVAQRLALGQPWLRLALIMAGVIAATALAAGLMFTDRARALFSRGSEHERAKAALFLLTAAGLATARQFSPMAVILSDRFLPGSGWLEILALAWYAAWLGGRLMAARDTARLRLKLWAFFSLVFFGQLALGLMGADRLLMTGRLHLPVPALILAGPVFRGDGFFMAVLFGVTVLLAGPAWCSHLCYIGAWDGIAAAKARPDPQRFSRSALPGRLATLALALGSAWAMRSAGIPAATAAWAAAVFGLAGVGIMITLSRRSGTMVHCSTYCPMGLVGNVLGRLNPFRVRMNEDCTRCGACASRCRYAALTAADIERGRPGLSCTLCGDCLGACAHGSMGFTFPGLAPASARTAFLVLVVSLHAIFLGVARI